MTEQLIAIADAGDIPAAWGTPRTASRRGTVTIREPRGREVFTLSWGELTAEPGVDLVVGQPSGESYPIKKDIFARTYRQVAPGRYRKATRSRLLQVPEGVAAVLTTREGELLVRHPDYLAIGEDGEVYANAAAWVADKLECD